MNRVILIGRLTKDPELRYTPSGVAVTQFTLAIDRPYKNQQGEKEADFIPVVTWRQLAETCANYLGKGRLVAVEGRLQVRHYDNNEGRRVYVTEVVADNVRFLESSTAKPQNNNNMDPFGEPPAERSSFNANQNQSNPFSDDGKPIDISDDDLPF